MRRTKVMVIMGTRPEAVKMAPIVEGLRQAADRFDASVCVTAQHRGMLDQVLDLFSIKPDFDLDIMSANQSPIKVMSLLLERLDPVLDAEKPDWVLVQGDTTTVMMSALVAYHHRIRVGHVEAGLRTRDKYQPFPEEINRRVADVISDLYFAPTLQARANLLYEGVPDSQIAVTGNTVVDALQQISSRPFDWGQSPLSAIPTDRHIVLVTAHRRENFGAGIRNICEALRELASQLGSHIHIVYPVHPNPNIQTPVYESLGSLANVTLLPPLDYLSLVHLLKRSRLVLTDSGGIQEEAPSLSVPVLVLRETTERPEAIEAGTAELVGTDPQRIITRASALITDSSAHRAMSAAKNPFGDGHAADKIIAALDQWIGGTNGE